MFTLLQETVYYKWPPPAHISHIDLGCLRLTTQGTERTSRRDLCLLPMLPQCMLNCSSMILRGPGFDLERRRPFSLLFDILNLSFVLSIRLEVFGLERNILPEEHERYFHHSFHILLLHILTNQGLKFNVHENHLGKVCKI